MDVSFVGIERTQCVLINGITINTSVDSTVEVCLLVDIGEHSKCAPSVLFKKPQMVQPKSTSNVQYPNLHHDQSLTAPRAE
jgi:hypothetical protein